MPKRKTQEKEDKRRKKIMKLEERLNKYKAQLEERSSPDSEEPVIEQCDPRSSDHLEEVVVETLSLIDNTELNEKENTLELPSEVLSALGETSSTKKNYGDEIHPDIIKIIENILTEGLTKEQKENLIKTMLIPSNAKLLDAPKLNSELTGIINSASKTRDNLMEGRQQDMGLATSVILRAIQEMSKNCFDKINAIKMLGESARLLSNLHFQYTSIRRKLISPFLDKTLQQNLKENRRTEFLYSKLEDTVKTTTAMKRAANILKQKPAAGSSNYSTSKNYQHSRNPNQLHYKKTNRGAAHQPKPRFQPPPPPRPRQEPNRQQTPSIRGRGRYP